MKQEITKEHLRHRLNHTSVPDVAEGWAVMQTLLEADAAERRLAVRVILRRVAVAAALLFLVGFSAWWLLNNGTEPIEPIATVPAFEPAETPSPLPLVSSAPGKTVSPEKKEWEVPAAVTGSPSASAVDVAERSVAASALLTPLSAQPLISVLPTQVAVSDQAVGWPAAARRWNQGLRLPSSALPLRTLATEAPAAARTQPSADRPWHIGIQLNANGGSSFGSAGQNFNPVLKGTPVDVYPSVSVSKRLSDRMGIQAGLAVVSPVEIAGDHFKRSVPNTDRNRVAMAATTADEFQISRLYYVDVPVTMQYHIGKRFTVGSGLQLSVLQKVIGQQRRVDYAADYTVMYAAPQQPAAENLTGNESAAAGIKPLDLRWLGTFKYQLADRWTAALRLQYGLLDVSDNAAFLYNHHDHNTVVSAGIGFLIK